jgi:hypothetical protein
VAGGSTEEKQTLAEKERSEELDQPAARRQQHHSKS